MCGLTGFIDLARETPEETLRSLAARMAARIENRGPDDSGTWVDAAAGVALGHRRLSIIDLSEAGHQPMISSDGRFVMAYNGEVYNFRELRAELEAAGKLFQGHSDSEVILEGWATWGAATTVERLIGIFALAVWDRRERTLTLVRDRLGIKPLYLGRFGCLFFFGSELKALRGHDGWTPEINRDALSAFFVYSTSVFEQVPEQELAFREIYRVLKPGGLSLHNFPSKWRPIESHMRVPLGGIADENEPNARLRARGLGGVEHVSDPVHHAVGAHLTRQEGLDDAPIPC